MRTVQKKGIIDIGTSLLSIGQPPSEEGMLLPRIKVLPMPASATPPLHSSHRSRAAVRHGLGDPAAAAVARHKLLWDGAFHGVGVVCGAGVRRRGIKAPSQSWLLVLEAQHKLGILQREAVVGRGLPGLPLQPSQPLSCLPAWQPYPPLTLPPPTHPNV
jgi:hypothetical protein